MELETKPGMTTDPAKASPVPSEAPGGAEQPPAGETSGRIGEGLGVFRALLLMLLFYLAAGLALWLVWNAWRH